MRFDRLDNIILWFNLRHKSHIIDVIDILRAQLHWISIFRMNSNIVLMLLFSLFFLFLNIFHILDEKLTSINAWIRIYLPFIHFILFETLLDIKTFVLRLIFRFNGTDFVCERLSLHIFTVNNFWCYSKDYKLTA